MSGLSEAWIAVGLIIGAWLNWLLVAGRLRVHTEVQNNALTLPDYFTGRFADRKRILRMISAVVILVFFAIYCASAWWLAHVYLKASLAGTTPLLFGLAQLQPSVMYVSAASLLLAGQTPSKQA